MANKFVLSLPENGFVYPCNICANRNQPVAECKDCPGYVGSFVFDELDLKREMEREERS